MLEHLHDTERIILEGDLGNLDAAGTILHVIDVVVFFCRVVTGFTSLLEFPMPALHKTSSTNKARRVLQERVIVEDTDELQLNISGAITGVEKEAARTGVERKSHGIDGEIPTAEVFADSRGGDDG